jgi:N-acetyl-anhydromuramyl-L-alanine amidase AmpD
MGDPKTYQFNLPSENRPSNIRIPEFWYPGIREYWQRSTSTRMYNPIHGIRAVVVHATAGSSSDGAVTVMGQGRASFHWLIPDEDEPQHGEIIWACAPESLVAWHVRNDKSHPDVWGGRRKINHWSLGIEVVNSQRSSDRFSDWQVEITAKIIRYCWAKYPNLVHIVSHALLDPERRSDPGANFPWEIFKGLVLNGTDDPLNRVVDLAIAASEISAENIDGCCMG